MKVSYFSQFIYPKKFVNSCSHLIRNFDVCVCGVLFGSVQHSASHIYIWEVVFVSINVAGLP